MKKFKKNWKKIALGIIGVVLSLAVLISVGIFLRMNTWKTYINTKYGFTLRYPATLSVVPREIDIQSNYLDYLKKCDNGTYMGCGGGRWPDFEISFLKNNGKSAFDVRIYQESGYFGGKENDGFTYLINNYRYFGENIEIDPVDKATLEKISNSLTFIKSEKPLACLWSITTGKVLDSNSPYITGETSYPKSSFSLLKGFYYDSGKNSCMDTQYYTWKGQENSDKPPFDSLRACNTACVK